MQLIRRTEITVLSNSGVRSEQLLFPENAPTAKVTITRVTMLSGAVNPRHAHESSEQVWVALEGEGELLLAEGRTVAFEAGDVARFGEGEVHGFKNTGPAAFVYISVTSPPLNFRKAYEGSWSTSAQERTV